MEPPEWSRQNEAAKGGGLTCDHAGWRIAIAIVILIGNGNGNGEQLRPLKALLDITLGYHSWISLLGVALGVALASLSPTDHKGHRP